MQNDKITKILKGNLYAVVSSVNRAGQPESALVGMSITNSGEVVFATNDKTRKVENLRHNPNISLVVGFGADTLRSVQIEGVARVVAAQDAGVYANSHYQKIPSAKKHQNTPGECFVIVTPIWARYTDFTQDKDEIFEVDFDAS